MNQYSLSETVLQQISETVRDLTARDTARISRACSRLALQNMANSNFDQAHLYLALAKEFMLTAVRRKTEMTEAETKRAAAAETVGEL